MAAAVDEVMEIPTLSTEQVADLIGVKPDTLRGWSRDGTHGFPRPVIRPGRKGQRFDRGEILAWLEHSGRVAPVNPRHAHDPVRFVLRQLAASESERVAAWAKGLLESEDEVEQGPAPRRKKRAAAVDYSAD
jgi:hypothetical protein